MPSGARDTVIGGGINPIAPFTIGAFPVVVNDDPAAVADSILKQIGVNTLSTTGTRLQMGANASDNNRLQFLESNASLFIGPANQFPALGTEALCFGRNSGATGVRAVAISGTASGQDSLTIGGSVSGNASTAMGSGSNGSGADSAAFGSSALAVSEAASLGTSASCSGVATRGIAIGCAASTTHANAGAIGAFAASKRTGCITIGRDFAGQGDVWIPRILGIGTQLRFNEGANKPMGVATLVAGTVVVANTQVTATSRILLVRQAPGGGALGHLAISARVVGTSFTILSTSAAEVSDVLWIILDVET